MKVTKFKLVDDGYNGILIEGIEYIKKGNVTIPDSVKRQRKVAIDDATRESIQKLKYFYLNLTGHWIAPYTKYYDLQEHKLLPLKEENGTLPQGQSLLRQLWNETKITGVSLSETGFVITGTIEVVAEKIVGISTPHITEDDDIGFYLEAREYIDTCVDNILGYFKKNVLMPFDDPKKYLQEYVKDNLEGMSTEEMTEMVIERLSQKGAIIMMSDEDPDVPAIGDGRENVEVHQSGSIDKDNIPVEKEEKEEEVTMDKSEGALEVTEKNESLVSIVDGAESLKELKSIVKEYDEFKSLRGILTKFSSEDSLRSVMLASLVVKAEAPQEDNDWPVNDEYVVDESPLADMEYSAKGNFKEEDE